MTAARDTARFVVAGVAIVLLTALILKGLGHPWICSCGTVKLWHGITFSSENSQHLSDWYTPSHVIHGFLFFFGLWMVAGRRSLGFRAIIAILIEASWEIVENTSWIINRYREATIALDYFGDSILNSIMDIVAMLAGFWLAARLPVWLSVFLVIAMELVVAYFIRDNLSLNIIMLVYPLDAIREWQMGG
jgi:hypothetical protein